MKLPAPRGPLSQTVVAALRSSPVAATAGIPRPTAADAFLDEDLQLSLWVLYELHYRGFDDVDPAAEWDPALLSLRAELERAFEEALRQRTGDDVAAALKAAEDVPDQIEFLIDRIEVPSVASYLQREATRERFEEYLRLRSIYHLKESDPHSFVLPRLDGPAKAALAELQYDEYGAGRPERVHATMYADALASLGLDAAYGAYLEELDAATLAVNNVMSLFGLHRRLRGAAMGHLAAFESTSSAPCRRVAAGAQRLELPGAVFDYYDEHVEADAVHEQVATRSICGELVRAEPGLREDVLFGVAACLHLDAVAGARLLSRWQDDDPIAEEVS